MADIDANFGAAYYRPRDPIKHLVIRVKLERLSATTGIPQKIPNKKKENESEDGVTDAPVDISSESYDFNWQEKVYSKGEVAKYKVLENCETVLEKKYHEDAVKLSQIGRPTNRLFSYVEHDPFTASEQSIFVFNQQAWPRLLIKCKNGLKLNKYKNLPKNSLNVFIVSRQIPDSRIEKMHQQFTTVHTESKTSLAEKMDSVRHRKGALGKSDRKQVPRTNLVIQDPSDELKKNNRLVSGSAQTMYIMADLAPPTRESTAEDEVVLCTIRVDGNGVLSITPDFNKGRRPYKAGGVQGRGMELCQYTIENSSKQLTRQEQEKEFKMYREMYARHADFLASCVGQEFQMTPPDILRVVVHGEIISASKFEYDDLFIDWFIDLPDGWVPNGIQPMSGVTQTCSTTIVGVDDVAYFSYPFSFDLLYRPSQGDNNNGISLHWPQLFFEVISLDSWQRYRAEGYGCLTLPNLPGTTVHQVQCWRPARESCVSELRRFFIGGNPELEDPTYVMKPSTFDGTHLSKFGFRSVSSGFVCLRTNVILQSQALLSGQTSKKKAATVVDKLGFTVANTNILNVLEAFQRAKQRMVAARDHLKRDFIETMRTLVIDETDA